MSLASRIEHDGVRDEVAIEEPLEIRVGGEALALKLDRAPRRVYSAPDETPVDFEYLAGRVNLRVPEVRGHAMIVFEE